VSADIVLQAMGLEVRFARGRDEVRAVDGVELAVRRGEILALVGESGCGKTTLARTILGLARPASGAVTLDGQPLPSGTSALRAYRKRVQLVLQDPAGALNPRHSVYEAVAEGLRVHHTPGDEVELVSAALAKAGLRPPARFFLRYPHELSGGQRQRVVIAGALVVEPDVLIADEPVSALDASVRGEILALLLRLRSELELTVVVVTHDLGLAWNIADRIAVMYLGRIVEIGTVDEVLREARHPYTRALLSVVPEIDQVEPVVLRGEPPDATRIPAGCRFRPRCPLYADSADAALRTQCETEALAVLPDDGTHRAACHALLRPPPVSR
jgi:peptide/nickel transport system ATP-binding protein